MLEAAGFEFVSITDSHPVADGFTSVIIEATTARDLMPVDRAELPSPT